MDIQYLIQGGAVGIAIFALWMLYKVITNHEKHFTDAITKNTEALTKLGDCINNIKEVLGK